VSVSRYWDPRPPRSPARRRALAVKLRAIVDQIDAGGLVVRGCDDDGVAHDAARLRERLARRIEGLEGGRR
jgi:hypothetical protein